MARLPQPGGDDGNWGTLLNEFLLVSHTSTGTLSDGTVGAATIQNGSVGDAQIGMISQNKVGGLPAALSAKASNASVIHTTGDESADGIKTFTASPIIPNPSNGNQAANKSYVDSVASVGTPDANATTKGKIQLAGDLGGTATSPTVPALAGKENTIAPGTTTQYYRGDKTFQTLDKTSVGLANVDNTTDLAKPISTATQSALEAKVTANGAITGATSTKITYDAKGLVTSGTSATQDDIIDGTTNKQFSVTEKTKLAAIAAGATLNSSDATLLDRDNHTGTQTASTISDFTEVAQDAVGSGLVDTNTIDLTYDDTANQMKADARTQLSIASDASGLKLAGDVLSPGNNKYYGTDAVGAKGFHDVPIASAVSKTLQVKIMDDATTLTTGDGKFVFAVSSDLNALNLTSAHAYVTTASSSGLPSVQVRNITNSNVDMLSTAVTIDVTEVTSYTATTPSVVNPSNDNVATGNLLAIDVDSAGTGAKGLGIILTFGA